MRAGEKGHAFLRRVGDVDLVADGGGVEPAKPGRGGIGDGGVDLDVAQEVVTRALRINPQHGEKDGVHLQQPVRVSNIVAGQIQDVRPAREDPLEQPLLVRAARPAGQRQPATALFHRHVWQIPNQFPECMGLGGLGGGALRRVSRDRRGIGDRRFRLSRACPRYWAAPGPEPVGRRPPR